VWPACWERGLAAVASQLAVDQASLSIDCRVSSCLERVWQQLDIPVTNLDHKCVRGTVLTWFKRANVPARRWSLSERVKPRTPAWFYQPEDMTVAVAAVTWAWDWLMRGVCCARSSCRGICGGLGSLGTALGTEAWHTVSPALRPTSQNYSINLSGGGSSIVVEWVLLCVSLCSEAAMPLQGMGDRLPQKGS